ncbi:MAG: MFS transporter [Propionibacteriaceae bacterium]
MSESPAECDTAIPADTASLRERGLPWLWSARTISSLGTTFTMMTVTYWATVHLGLSGSQIALVELGPLLIAILSPLFVGVLVDSTDRRVLLSLVHIGCAVVLFTATGLAWTDKLGFSALIAVNAVLSIFSSIEGPAKFASFYDMVGDKLIDRANGLTQTINTATDSLGAVIAGTIIKVLGAPVLFLIDALSFILEAIAPWAVTWANPDAIHPTPAAEKEPYFRRAFGGFAVIAKNPLIRTLVFMSTTANGVIAFSAIPLTLMMLRRAAIPYLAYTIILSIGSAGAILGGVVAAKIAEKLTGPRAQVLSLFGYGLCLFGYAFIGGNSLAWITYAAIIDFGVGFCISIYVVNNATAQHRAIASEIRGRVGVARKFLGAIVMAFATALGGFLVDHTSAPALIIVSAIALLLVAGYGMLSLRKSSVTS